MERKRYIFITNGIKDIGGVELYILNKCAWLEENGWETFVISAAFTKEKYKIKYLEKYRKGNVPSVAYAPFECGVLMSKTIVKQLLKYVCDGKNYSETIIESHSGSTALWGELLAEKLSAKHILLLLMESFAENAYLVQREFFIYKLKRREVFAGKHCLDVLFREQYHVGDELLKYNNTLYLQENPVADIEDERIKKIKECDDTICYIGRPEKIYFSYILDGVCRYSRNHPERSVQFVVIGNTDNIQESIDLTLKGITNIVFLSLGEMVPIPRKLFSKVDVVCAGSGSARCAANEHVPTIIGDADNGLSNGVLGYDTILSVGHDETTQQTSFDVSLEDVLIRKDYLKKLYRFQPEPSVEECCVDNLKKIRDSGDYQEYYPCDQITKGYCTIKRRLLTISLYLYPDTLNTIDRMVRKNGK